MVTLRAGPATWDPGERVAELETLAVLPEERSAGAGHELMAAAGRLAGERGAEALSVGLVHTNERVRRFYEREGAPGGAPRLPSGDGQGPAAGVTAFGKNCGMRQTNRTMPPCTIIPQLTYDNVGEAVRWLCDKFGFRERWHAGEHRAQLCYSGGSVVVTEPLTSKVLPGRQSLMVRVDDVDAHFARTRRLGVKIIDEPRDFPYGERQYTAEDLAGHQWSFSQSIADVAPEEWGGTSGPALSEANPEWADGPHG
jgi:uncharacterized glyoxalase superfamily protein PhnB